MPKLIYAQSKTGFETAFPTGAPRDAINKSIVFTADGYLWTHGKYFRIFDATTTFEVSYASGTNVSTGNIVSLKDVNGNTLTTFDVGVTSVVGGNILTAGTLTNGSITIDHDTIGTAGSVGGNATSESVVVPQFTVDAYGHITVKGSSTATLDNVKVEADITTNGEYRVLLGTTSASVETIELNKAANLKFNPSTGTLTATKYIGALNYNVGITLNGASAVTFDNTANRSFTLFSPTTSGTTSTSTYLTPTTDGAPVWQAADTTVTQNSTNLVTSGAVHSAVNAAVATADAMVYKGVRDASATGGGLPAANKGDTYKISVAGTFNNTKTVEVGDMIICNTDNTAAVAYASIVAGTWTNWDIIQTNLVSTTVGLNLLNLANPSAVTFIRVNADNSVSTRSAAELKTDLSLNYVENTALSTWTGNGFIASVGTITSGTWNASTIAVNRGGTGLTSYTLGDILYASAATTLAKLAGNTTTVKQYLSQTGNGTTSAAPVWAAIAGGDVTGAALTKTDDTNVTLTLGGSASTALLRAASITVGWTGNLAIGRGGTGITSYAVGDMLYASGTTTLAKLAKPGTNGYVLKFNTTTNAPYWDADIDTHWTANLYVGASGAASNAATTNENTYLKLYENSTSRASFKISGTGATTVASDSSGNITINSTNSWRAVTAYAWTSGTPGTLTQGSIGTENLDFGDEFIWNSTTTELKLGWAEVDGAGAITYSV